MSSTGWNVWDPMHPRVFPDDDVRAVLDALRRIVRHLRGPGAESARRSTAQLFVLSVLSDGTPLSVNELAARTHTHQSSVSVVAKRLVEAGLVRRTRSSADRRRLDLSITARGRALLARHGPVPQTELVRAVASLSPRRRHALVRSLAAVLDRLPVPAAAPPMFFEEGPRGRRRSGHP